MPIEDVPDVTVGEVTVEGEITQLSNSSDTSIFQVGLIEDDSRKTKLTSWATSDQSWIEEGERVRIHGAEKNWYNGHVSVALTGWSIVHFPERGRWREA